MNLMQGKFGKQEAIALGLGALLTNGFTNISPNENYSHGNSQYISTLVAGILACIIVNLTVAAMKKHACSSLFELIRKVMGRFVGGICIVVIIAVMILSAALPQSIMIRILSYYVYTQVGILSFAAYFLPCVIIIAYLGIETVARSTRLLIIPIIALTVASLLMAAPEFSTYKLFPLLGGGPLQIAYKSLVSLFRILPPFIAIMSIGDSLQGTDNIRYCMNRVLLIGCGILFLSEICIGLTYSYKQLSNISLPLYNMTMVVRYAHQSVRIDKIALFIWVVSTLLTSAFYAYTAALLLTKNFELHDIRPSSVSIASITTMIGFLASSQTKSATEVNAGLMLNTWTAILGVFVLLLVLAALRKRKVVVCINDY